MQNNEQDDRQAATSTPAGSGAHPVPKSSAHAVQPSGPKGDDPATAGPGPTKVTSSTPENSGTPEDRSGHLNPSAPEDSNTTPGTTTAK